MVAEQAQSLAGRSDAKPQAAEVGTTLDWAAGTRTVYLDQFVFVRLARARKGSGGQEDFAVRNSLLREELTAHVAFPLSRVHYLETWRKGDSRKRREIAEEMALFSRFLTLGHCRSLWRHEIDHALRLIFNKPALTTPIPVWGWGALHAFGWECPPAGWLSGDTFFELSFLAGSSRPQLAHYEQERHAQEQQFAKTTSLAAARLSSWRADRQQRQRRLRLQALTDFEADLIPAFIAADIPPEELAGLSDSKLEELVQAIPTIWTLTELRRVRLANPQQGFTAHDLNDLRALASALVYCDIVVTDKAWCNAVGRTDLQKQLGTVVLNDVTEVEHTLRYLDTSATR